MKNIFAPALIVVIIFSFFGCSENPEDKKKREMDIEYLRIIGRAYLEEDRLDEAKETFNSLIEAAPDDASGYANLGLVFLKQNKYDEAKTKIEKALKKAPGNPDILMISAQYFVLTNNTDKAISELQKIIKADPDYAKAYYSLAGLYELSGAKDALAQREKYLRLAMEKAPGNIVPRLDLTGLLMKKGDPSGATQQLEELPKLFPDFPKEAASFYEKAMAALHAGDNATATNYVAMFQNFLKVTSQYQSDLRDLEGPNGSLAGLSVVSISDFNMMHAQADESILDRIRFLDITSNMGLNPATENGGSGGQSNDAISHLTLGDYDGDGYVDVYF
ncbi:MAG: tetratricopeptide repeat protein, partial [Saprospiraceae bacterium]